VKAPGLNHAPPARSKDPVMIWIAHANHSVMLASAAMVHPVPVITVTVRAATISAPAT